MKIPLFPLIVLCLSFSLCCSDNGNESGGDILEGIGPPLATEKKGIAAARFGADKLVNAKATWYYNWSNTPNDGDAPDGVDAPEYVPMIARSGDATDDNFNRLREGALNGTYTHLLGFNEPDSAGQANMSVDAVIAQWPRLMETGLRLGSPAPTWLNSWMDEFMTKAAARDLRVDFVCLHFYRSPNALEVVDELKSFIDDAWDRWGKPIWLTEFGAPDCNSLGWCGDADPLTQAQTDAYVDEVIAMLEAHPHVERYAWFVDRAQDGFELSAILDDNGELTRTGAVFSAAGGQ